MPSVIKSDSTLEQLGVEKRRNLLYCSTEIQSCMKGLKWNLNCGCC